MSSLDFFIVRIFVYMYIQCAQYIQKDIHQRADQPFSESMSPIHDGELRSYTNATAGGSGTNK